jgi:energy-coupling factor transport system ATP-binding protein
VSGLVCVESLSHHYVAEERAALGGISYTMRRGEVVALLGPSGSGKSTLLRALSGLIPHFHGGRFAGCVTIAGLDTRRVGPAELAGTVATVFQDPEEQVVMSTVAGEVSFGLENVGVPVGQIVERVEEALDAVGALHLIGRRTTELSGGELQRVCLAAAIALRPDLLLLDEPTSQLDPAGAELFLRAVEQLETTVVMSEHRVARALELASRVQLVERGSLALDGPAVDAVVWLERNRPELLEELADLEPASCGEPLLALSGVDFAYGDTPVLEDARLELRAGEVVALSGPNGAGKTTLARIAAGLLEPAAGEVFRNGRVGYLPQDPGRYMLTERVLDEVALSVGGDRDRARLALADVGLAWAESRHPRDLSSGERERLGLAAVAVSEPRVLVLDEPTRGLDPERRRSLGSWLAEYASRGNAVLVATHDDRFPAHRRVSLAAAEVAVAC